MTDLRTAAQQALEALEDHAKQYPHMQKGYTVDAITALRAALAQQAEPVEPVAWVRLEAWKSGKDWPDDCFTALPAEGLTPVYTAPPQRKPLTEGMLMGVYIDFDRAADPAWSKAEYLLHFARAVERVHGIGGQE